MLIHSFIFWYHSLFVSRLELSKQYFAYGCVLCVIIFLQPLCSIM